MPKSVVWNSCENVISAKAKIKELFRKFETQVLKRLR
jgi:hypothetical protein